jgi:hypothetical protein
MRFGESKVHERDGCEIEIEGVIQKKNRNGFWQNRYFLTEGTHLKYWLNYEKYIAEKSSPSSTYDFREVTSIFPDEDYKSFCLQFMNEKFKLELRGISEKQNIEWINFCRSKQKLYSVDQLRLNINEDTVTFQTKTFFALLQLERVDQVFG